MNSYYCEDEFDPWEYDSQGNVIVKANVPAGEKSEIIPGYIVVHKLVKRKCCWCDEPEPATVKRAQIWNKNASYVVESGNHPADKMLFVLCSEYMVLATMKE
jgi:hypothetical protein